MHAKSIGRLPVLYFGTEGYALIYFGFFGSLGVVSGDLSSSWSKTLIGQLGLNLVSVRYAWLTYLV